jgi:signal transduction histidine kinase/DNA-binding response OmpR family regulator
MTETHSRQGPSFVGGGEMGDRIRAFDWSTHPLGPADQWPQSLKTIIRVMLDSRYAMWLGWGPDLTFFYNDVYAAKTLGPKHPWALGRPAREVWSEIWDEIGSRAESVLATGKATWDEGLLLFLERRGFAEETYHTFSYSPVPDDRGGVGGLLCVVTEDTERAIGERRLRTLRELSASTNETATSAELACRSAAEILDANPQDVPFALFYLLDKSGEVASLAGAAGVEDGSPVRASSIAVHATDAAWPFGEVIRSGETIVVDDLSRRFGPLLGRAWADPVTTAVVLPMAKSGQSQLSGFVVAGVSPRRPFDDGYRGFFDLLARQVATAVASARAYDDERRRAEALAELDRAKTTFFSNVSHEFRTPLTLMLGPVEDRLAKPDDYRSPSEQELLELIHRSGLRLLKLVNTLLDFSRIEAGRARATFEPVDLGSFTTDLASVFRSAVERAGLRLIVECDPLGAPVHVDRDMWEKIVLNLLSNAFKFTFVGEIHLRLERSGDRAVLTVKDSGVGIPASELPHVFERFHRVEGTRRRTHEGTGIGLALVHELAKLHGGTVAVSSVEGVGTTFTVSIPMGTDRLVDAGQAAPSGSVIASVAPRLYAEEAERWLPEDVAGERPDAALLDATSLVGAALPLRRGEPRPHVLVADDNADMRKYVTNLLGALFDVEAVRDGKEALDVLRKRPADIVVSDVMMSGLDGFGLLRAMRADERLRRIPLLLLSARAGEESRVEGMVAGADDYLTKPFSGRELVARVSAHLELARVRLEAENRERGLRNEAELLNEVAQTLAAELDLDKLLQKVTDAATSLTHAAFGAFFYNTKNEHGEAYLLYTLSGAPREAFEKFGTPRNTAVFAATFAGEGPVRLDDVLEDPRYGLMPPHYGMPKGHLPVRSYLAVPVKSRTGEVLGGLFFGHPERARFTAQAERIALGIAAQAAVAIDVARALQSEREARTDAERSSHLKDEFLATLSHELRTPLNAISGWSHLIQQHPSDAEMVKQGIEVIGRNAKVQADLIADLLDMSRIISGKLRLNIDAVVLSEVVEAALDSVRHAAEAKGVRIRAALGPLSETVRGDASRLQQIVWNLLSNAVKFTPKGGRIDVTLLRKSSHIEIVVSDTGVGVSPEFLPHLFERFRQADASTARRYGGLGLGLSIVKHLVELHGGNVEAHSEGEGRGTTFTVQLPLAVVHGRAVVPDRVETEPMKEDFELEGVRVLAVDDQADARELVRRVLEERGADVVTAASVDDGLVVLERHRPHVVLCDIGMPGKDGYEFIRQVRDRGDVTPALAVTAFARAEDRLRALRAGFQGHVVKPVAAAELVATVAAFASPSSRAAGRHD